MRGATVLGAKCQVLGLQRSIMIEAMLKIYTLKPDLCMGKWGQVNFRVPLSSHLGFLPCVASLQDSQSSRGAEGLAD